jgi:hypothetical protein
VVANFELLNLRAYKLNYTAGFVARHDWVLAEWSRLYSQCRNTVHKDAKTCENQHSAEEGPLHECYSSAARKRKLPVECLRCIVFLLCALTGSKQAWQSVWQTPQ